MTVIPFPEPHEPRPGARGTDPATSWKAARINQRYRNQLRFNMLYTHGVQLRDHSGLYLAQGGMTADEISRVMNLPVPANGGSSKMCHWKRHSELYKEYGFLRVSRDQWGNEMERHDQHVLLLAPLGLQHLDEVLARYPQMTERLYD